MLPVAIAALLIQVLYRSEADLPPQVFTDILHRQIACFVTYNRDVGAISEVEHLTSQTLTLTLNALTLTTLTPSAAPGVFYAASPRRRVSNRHSVPYVSCDHNEDHEGIIRASNLQFGLGLGLGTDPHRWTSTSRGPCFQPLL